MSLMLALASRDHTVGSAHVYAGSMSRTDLFVFVSCVCATRHCHVMDSLTAPVHVQAPPSDRQTATDRAEFIMSTIVTHYSHLMPQASLAVGTLQSLIGQRDNKLFDSLQAVCCTPTADPFYPPGQYAASGFLLVTHTTSHLGTAAPQDIGPV